MAAARLNKTLCTQLAKKLTAVVFAEKIIEAIDENVRLADEVYNFKFTEADRERMNALPDGYLPQITSLSVNAGGYNGLLCFDVGDPIPYLFGYGARSFDGNIIAEALIKRLGMTNEEFKARKKEQRRVFFSFYSAPTRIDLTDEAVCKEVRSRLEATSALGDEMSKFFRDTETSLNAMKTVTRLKNEWPEAAEFLPADLGASVGGVPAPRVEELKEKLSKAIAA